MPEATLRPSAAKGVDGNRRSRQRLLLSGKIYDCGGISHRRIGSERGRHHRSWEESRCLPAPRHLVCPLENASASSAPNTAMVSGIFGVGCGCGRAGGGRRSGMIWKRTESPPAQAERVIEQTIAISERKRFMRPSIARPKRIRVVKSIKLPNRKTAAQKICAAVCQVLRLGACLLGFWCCDERLSIEQGVERRRRLVEVKIQHVCLHTGFIDIISVATRLGDRGL